MEQNVAECVEFKLDTFEGASIVSDGPPDKKGHRCSVDS